MSSNNNKNISQVNPDLINERQTCTFRSEELTYYIDGSKEATEARRAREEYYLSDPALKPSAIPSDYLSHKEKYEEAMRMSVALFRRAKQMLNETGGPIDVPLIIGSGSVGSALMGDGNPLIVHLVMFTTAIMGQGSPEQVDKWIPRSFNLELFGTYAQTELGHGTFIRGLETTATYDEETQEFVLNSPTLTSYKWWPGGLGHASNYAIVMAQLYTKGKCHGVHAFIVQLRDEDTNMPMKGIKIGEIGCKMGINTVNNGYLGLENVRIPRDQMLMKNNKVMEDGTYVKGVSSKLTYGTMIYVRVHIVRDTATHLKKAITIAMRYSAVRRQSQIKEGEPETQIMNFVTQQHKLFPLLGTFFAYWYSANWLQNLYEKITGEMNDGQLDSLPELHAIASCLKAVSSADCSTGVETCRLSCGGHGYMTSSNLPKIYGLAVAACTYEGENTVMLLQSARYLIKSYQNFLDGKTLTPTVSYIEKYKNMSTPPFQKRVEWIIQGFEKVSACKIETAYNNIQKRMKKGIVYEYAWNETSVELATAAEMHCRVNVLAIFNEEVQSSKTNMSREFAIVMQQLLELYSVYIAIRFSGDLLRFTNTIGNDISQLQVWMEELLAAIRPNAIGIVDGFDMRDEEVQKYLESTDFPPLRNERILITAKGGIPDKLPVWVMRQAGRYLSEFREFRKQHSFFEICRNPQQACEVTLMPIIKFDLDAAIIFSDILVVPQALGMEVVMEPEKGPVFPKPLTIDTVKDLNWNNPVASLEYVGKALRLTRHMLKGKVPLLGFSAAPWTLMVYMIEGGGTKTASKAKKWIYENPSVASHLANNLAKVIIEYLVMQIEWGAQMVQLFESSAEYLTNDVYRDMFLDNLKLIVKEVRSKVQEKKLPMVPIVFFAKGGRHLLDLELEVGFDVLSLDWATDPADVRATNKEIVLQGNLDPCALYADRDTLEKHVIRMLKKFGYKHHIVNLGHGIYPDVNPDAVGWLVDIVHNFKNPNPEEA